jgi:hypothetical protein
MRAIDVTIKLLLSDYQVMGWAEQGAQLRLFGFGVTKSLRDTEFLRFSDGSVIATSAVPEPSTCAMAFAGLACGGPAPRRMYPEIQHLPQGNGRFPAALTRKRSFLMIAA